MTVPGRRRAFVAALTVAAAAVSLIRIRDLPVFGDEAIFLRFTRLVRSDPAAYAWISIRAAAAPLHTWLLAAAEGLFRDPVLAGRVLAVASGVVSIPAIAWCVGSMQRRFQDASPGDLAGPFAAALVATCPFFVWTQRVARVDSLFAAETILVAGAALHLAARAGGPGPKRRTALSAAGFGALMGVTMLTRTAVSYPFWLLPAAAFLLSKPGRIVSRAAIAGGISLAVGFGLFVPFLLARGPEDLATRLFHYGVTRPAVPLPARLALASGNAAIALESFARYLSVPVLATVAVSLVFLALRRRWRLLLYLCVWEAVALLPAMLFAGDYFSRYALPAAAPLLASVPLALDEARRTAGDPVRSRRRAVAAAALVLLLVATGPLRSEGFVRDWRSAPWTALDRWQLVSGWPAGASTEQAVAHFRKTALSGDLLVLTPEISGNPSDTVWLLLEGTPRIDLAFAMDALHEPLLRAAPGRPGSWQARQDLLRGGATRLFPCSSPRRILFVTSDPILTAAGWRAADGFFSGLNPGIRLAAHFTNPAPAPGERPTDGVAIFALRCPAD